MDEKPLCFVLMPFGRKPDPTGGGRIDFTLIYERAIRPGVADAGMTPIRADEERLGGIIHKAMYERLLVCDFAVADLTTANSNVLYELGVRHAARPRTTLTVHASKRPLPFDVRMLRTQSYDLDEEDNSFSEESAATLRAKVREHLVELRALRADSPVDSPLFQLVDGWNPSPLGLAATSSFKEQLRRTEVVKARLSRIRALGTSPHPAEHERAAVLLAELREQVVASGTTDVAVLTGVFLAYRALGDWTGMIGAFGALPEDLRQQVSVRQQLAFAHNRRAEATGDRGDRGRALEILEALRREQGPTPETSGMIGRIHKSQWVEASEAGEPARARGYLKRAVAAYVEGFEADWREVYPGINALTLLDVQGGRAAAELKQRLLPVVRFAVERRLCGRDPDYWDHATRLEIAVLDDDDELAVDVLDAALAVVAERWQPQSTADNLRIIERARRARGEEVRWLSLLVRALYAAAGAAGTADEGE
jgi:hypothetical protein